MLEVPPPTLPTAQYQLSISTSVTRSGDLLDFGPIFEAFGKNSFPQISHILRQFL